MATVQNDERLDSRFWRLWSAAAVSAAGDGLRLTALPLLAATATRDPRAVAMVTAAGFLPWPLFGLLGGAVADRVDRVRAMWAVDGVRALVLAAFAVLVAAGGPPPVVALVALAFLLGAAETVFDNAASALLPALVPRTQLASANARLFTVQTLAGQLLGPAAGGVLFALAAPLPLALDAASFLLAAVLVATLPRAHRLGGGGQERRRWSGLRGQLREGLAWLWGQPDLRTLAAVTATLAAVSGALLALLVLYAAEVLGLGARGYGLLFGCFALGSLAGALSAPALLTRARAGQLLLASTTITAPIFAVLGLISRAPVAAGALLTLGLAVGAWNITVTTVCQTLVPNPLLGRVSSAYRASALTATTAGAALAGFTAHQIGISRTLLGCALLVGLTVLALGRRLSVITLPRGADS